MLIPVQSEGQRPPLLLVHGMFGVLPWARGSALAQYLGPDQPILGLEAPGFDGNGRPRAKLPEAAHDYLAEVRRRGARPPFAILGVCGGAVLALQMAQQLAVTAQITGEPPPVPLLMLVDPPGLPGLEFTSAELTGEVAALLRERVSDWFAAARERLERLPFDVNDPAQMERAIDIGAAVEWSVSHYYPTPYSARVEVLAIERIAQMIGRQHWPWRRVFSGPWDLTVVACQHHELFTTHAGDVFAWVKSRLDEPQSMATERAANPAGKPR
jgi:thioesterase domain-containing protein